MSYINSIIVVGAGPAGMLLALMLAKRGISVRVVEQANGPNDLPRATHYGPPAVHELGRAGVLDDIRSQGFQPGSVCWRKLDGTKIGGLDNEVWSDDPDRMVALPLNTLAKILYKHLQEQPMAKVDWSHRVCDIGQDCEKAWVVVEKLDGTRDTITADYIVGCDGARSQVRRSLFGENFPGFTWDKQLVATNVYYDLHTIAGWEDANFIIHPEHWFMAARITDNGMWRITYGEELGLNTEQLRERQPEKWAKMLPGNPTPDKYQIVNFAPYRVHQRLADSMRVGRILLAADAAHLCNPFGGMGLTGGICDVGSLYDCLIAVWEGKADDSILDAYSTVRMQKFKDMIDPMSTENMRRLFDQDPNKAADADPFFDVCKRAQADPEFSLQMQKGMDGLRHDFSSYYKKDI
ncbi:FAD-binding monooxygenase [Ilyonectria destructans]|nr:FAD-binding monooxygenase [Ilyonectria destructans]